MTAETSDSTPGPTDATGAVGPIVASKLSKRYKEVLAVDAVDIDLPGGVVGGFVGPNGAGKTTTIQLLLGLSIRPVGLRRCSASRSCILSGICGVSEL